MGQNRFKRLTRLAAVNEVADNRSKPIRKMLTKMFCIET